ncbi:hypothetical protein OM427_25105 [Halomonas sp. 18H]|nr:hypothetical protein [Halomonas sp. 18H]MCW4152797.1 hypothetical protein [Halomonas sp. 18H]
MVRLSWWADVVVHPGQRQQTIETLKHNIDRLQGTHHRLVIYR